jgi:hypothetical protein
MQRINNMQSETKLRRVTAVFCIQETKMQTVDMQGFKKLTPKRFNKFAFSPSTRASGGLLVGWNNSIFIGQMISSSKFHIAINFTSTHNAENWMLIIFYGPCHGPDKLEFIDWLNGLQIPNNQNWLIV